VTVRVEVRPNVLAWARARSGIADDDWERRFPKFDAWLAGETAPTLKQLEAFASRTHTPVGFLFLDEPPVETVPIPDFRTIGDRPVGADAVVSADLLDVIYACERRQEWYQDNQILEGEPPLSFVGVASTDDPVEGIADQMREVLDWTAQSRATCRTADAALTWLREHAEAAGVLVMISGMVGSNTHRKLDPQEFGGFALVDEYASVVFVNGADSKSAQVSTLTRALAHVWLGASGLFGRTPEGTLVDPVEEWCSDVATAFFSNLSVVEGVGRARTRPFPACGWRFARAVRASVLRGRTPHPRAHRLLAVRKASALDRLFQAAAAG